MNIGAIAGLTGLAKNQDRVAQTQREMEGLNQLSADMEKDQADSMKLQEAEAAQYADIAAKASEMLEPDRDKIRLKSLELQKGIRAKIEEYGSRKNFFASGGVALLSKYKSDLLTSKETMSYADNKKNMESLMKLKESGKGHLISSLDLKSLNDYQQGTGDGKITYGGMKTEIEIPEKYFDYQEEIPAGNILHYKDNYMGIYGNWLIENPNKSGLTGQDLEEELVNYTLQNHSGRGTNETRRNHDMARQAVREQNEAVAKAGTVEETPVSYVAGMNQVFNEIQESTPATISELMKPTNFIKQAAITNKSLSGMLGHASEYTDIDSNYTETGKIDGVFKALAKVTGLDNKFAVASAVVVPMMKKDGVIKALYPGSPETGGVNVGLNSSEYYSPNGQKLSDDAVKRSIKTGTNQGMTFQGLIYAYVDGNDKMVTQIRDSNGKSLSKKDKSGKFLELSEEEKDHMTGFSGNLRNEMFSVLVNSDGEKIYHKINANSLKGESDLAEAIGKADDVTVGVKRRNENAYAKAANEEMKAFNAKGLQTVVAQASAQGGVFSSQEFKNEAKSTMVADGSNRATLLKAYYMTVSMMNNDGIVDSKTILNDKAYLRGNENNFSNRVGYSAELKNALINKAKVSDVNYIKMFSDIHTGKNEEDRPDNEAFATKWTKMLELLNKR